MAAARKTCRESLRGLYEDTKRLNELYVDGNRPDMLGGDADGDITFGRNLDGWREGDPAGLGHVATLRNDQYYGQKDVWWLVEGMAEYVQQTGVAPEAYPGRSCSGRFVVAHDLRTVLVQRPPDDASVSDASARYGVGYYALQHIAQRYGTAAMLDLFRLAVQNGLGLDIASRNALGKPWAVGRPGMRRLPSPHLTQST